MLPPVRFHVLKYMVLSVCIIDIYIFVVTIEEIKSYFHRS